MTDDTNPTAGTPAGDENLERGSYSGPHSDEVAKRLASDPGLSEDQALALLSRRDLPPESIELLSKNSDLAKRRKILITLISHPRTPRHLSVPLIRRLYIFELMKLALSPTLLADIKMVAEQNIISRLETASSGLCDPEPRVIRAALDNPLLTETLVVKMLMSEKAPRAFVEFTCGHNKWSLRRDVQVALLRNEGTPLERALDFSRGLPANIVREVLQDSRLPESIKASVQAELEQRL